MKNIILSLITFISLSFNLIAQTSLPNGSFENWGSNGIGYLELPGWTTCDDYAWAAGGDPISQAAGYNSTYAVQMQTKKFTFFSNPDSTAGFIESGIKAYNGDSHFQIAERSASLIGYYQFTQGSATLKDSARIYVAVLNNNDNDTLGTGTLYISQETTGYTPFTVPINYTSSGTPDSVYIKITGSLRVVPGTTLIVDEVSLTAANVTGINSTYSNPLGITTYPNPSTDVLNINNLPANTMQINVTDYSGKIVKQISVSTSLVSFSIDGVAPGLYFYSVVDNSGSVVYNNKFSVTNR